MSTGGGGWLTTKKRGRDDDQISRDKDMVFERRIEEIRMRIRRRDEEKKNSNVGRRLVARGPACTYTRRLMIGMKNDNTDDEEEDDGAHNDEVKPPVAVPAKTVPNDSFDDDHLSSSSSGSNDDDDDELDLLSEEEDLLSSSSSGDDDDDDDNMTDFEKMKLAFRLKMMKEPTKREVLIPPAKKATDKDDDDDDMTDFEKMKLAFRLKMMKEPTKREDLIPPAKKATEKEQKTKTKSHRQYIADIWEDSDDDDDDDDDNMTDFEKMKLAFRLKMTKEPKKRRPSQKSSNLAAPISSSAFILPPLPPSNGINHGQRNPLSYKSLLEYASKASPPSDGINHGQRNPLFYKSLLEYASKESPLMVLFDVTNDLRPSILCYLSVQDLSTAQICGRALYDAITPHWSELEGAMLTLDKPSCHGATGTTAKERVIKTTSAQTYAKRMDGAAARHYGFKIGPGMETRLGTYYGFPRRLMSFFYIVPKCIQYDFYVRLTRRNLPNSEYNAYLPDDEAGGEDTDDEIGEEEEEEGAVVVGEDDEEGILGINDGGSSGRDEGDEDDLWDDDTDSTHGNTSAIGEPYQADTNEDMIWEGFVKTVTYDMRQCALKLDMRDVYEQMDWKEMRDLTGLTRLSHPMYPTYRNRAIHNLRVIVVAIPQSTAWAKPSLVVATAGWDKDKQSIRGTHINYFMTSTKALPHNEYSSRIVNTQVSVQLSDRGNERGTFLGLIVK